MNKVKILTNGIIKENPIFVLLLGMCPTLGTTTTAMNGLAMGDGIGVGIGFTIGLTLLGALREVLGTGKIFDIRLFSEEYGSLIFVLAPGAFIALGYLIAIVNKVQKEQKK